MHAFKYHRPSSVNDAAALARGEAKLLAGGQTLVQTMKLRLASPSDIIDLGTIKDLAGIKSDGKSVTKPTQYFARIDTESLGQLKELHNVEPPLGVLIFRDE